MNEPFLMKIKSGWLARGKGWAVQAPTREAALGGIALLMPVRFRG